MLDALTREKEEPRAAADLEAVRQDDPFVTHGTAESVFLRSCVVVFTAGPARMADSFEIDLPNPRTLDIKTQETFGIYTRRIFTRRIYRLLAIRLETAAPSNDPETTMLKSASVLFATLVAGAAAQAVTLFSASLSNGQENPPTIPMFATGAPRPASFGTATFQLNDAQTALTFEATVFNIDFTGLQTADVNDNLTNAHIHASPAVTPTTNGPVVWGFFGAPFNDDAPNDVVVTPFASGVGGTVNGKWDLAEGNGTTLAAQTAEHLRRPFLHQFPHDAIRRRRDPRCDPSGDSGAGNVCAAGGRPWCSAGRASPQGLTAPVYRSVRSFQISGNSTTSSILRR